MPAAEEEMQRKSGEAAQTCSDGMLMKFLSPEGTSRVLFLCVMEPFLFIYGDGEANKE